MQGLKKRILVPIVGQGSITHIIRTGMLDEMAEFCEPVVGLLWRQEDLIEELRNKGYEVVFVPGYAVSPEYKSLRSKINLWYVRHKLRTPSVSIQQKYLARFRKTKAWRQLLKKARNSYYNIRFKLQPSYANELVRKEDALVKLEPVFREFSSWLQQLRIAGLFTVTPFLPEVDLIARILKSKSFPVLASIHSFDNVTKRGWPSVIFDHYIVWNKYNKEQLQRINSALNKEGSITIAGAPQFDFHFKNDFAWCRQEWLKRLGLPEGRKIILYSGGPVSLLPNEPQYLKHLKEAFEEGKISKDHLVLFRCHPLDKVERWKKYVGESPNIVYDSAPNGSVKLDQVNVVEDDLKKLISTLKHTEIHINVVSTMCVDGSTFNKPQIGPYYDEIDPGTETMFRKMYYQEHYVPIIETKVVHLAHNKNEFIALVNQMLADPAGYTNSCSDCVKEIISYSDGLSTKRAVKAIKKNLLV